MKNTIFGKAKIIDGDSLNRRIYQAVGAFSPIRLKQKSSQVHLYPCFLCQP